MRQHLNFDIFFISGHINQGFFILCFAKEEGGAAAQHHHFNILSKKISLYNLVDSCGAPVIRSALKK